MIWELLEILANPQEYAITVRNGEIFIEPIYDLDARCARIVDLATKGSRGSIYVAYQKPMWLWQRGP